MKLKTEGSKRHFLVCHTEMGSGGDLDRYLCSPFAPVGT
jgi:hypothetical protein